MNLTRKLKKKIIIIICKITSRKSYKSINLKKKNILINAQFKIGDTIMLFPLLRELKKSDPNIKIDILSGVQNNFMFINNPYVNQVYTLNKIHKFYKSISTFFTLKKNRYETIIDIKPIKFGNFIFLKLLKPTYFISNNIPNRYNIDVEKENCFDYTLNLNSKKIYMKDKLLEYAHLLNIPIKNKNLEIYFSDNDLHKAKAYLSTITSSPIIYFNIDGSAKERCIYQEDYNYIIKHISNTYPTHHIILSCLPSRRFEITEYLKKNNFSNVSLIFNTNSIFEIMALISLAKLVITPDTSIVHISIALNIPTIGIYSSVSSIIDEWKPNHQNFKMLQSGKKTINSIQGFDKKILLKYIKEMLS